MTSHPTGNPSQGASPTPSTASPASSNGPPVPDEPSSPEQAGGVEPRDHATVVLDDVSKWFGNKVAVSSLSLQFGPGVTGLLGPNGAGKTTLLRMVVGLQHPSRGTVRVLGGDPVADPAVQREIALVPEAPNVHAHLTARQFIDLSARLHRLDDPSTATSAAIEAVGLADAADRRLRTFSKGMRQRAKVAAALVVDPQVLVLDEPLNGADPVQRANLIALFTRLGEAGRTVIVSSHVLAEVDRMADRVVAMVDGRLAAIGTPRGLRTAMTGRPREVVLHARDPHALASALLAGRHALGVDVAGDRVVVRTADADAFARALPGIAHSTDSGLRAVMPADETLESVFRDIAAGV